MTEQALRGEFAVAASGIGSLTLCNLTEADQLVRLRHWFADVVLVRAA